MIQLALVSFAEPKVPEYHLRTILSLSMFTVRVVVSHLL